jgi:hypothetical protein
MAYLPVLLGALIFGKSQVYDRPADTFPSYPGDLVTKVADDASFSFSFTVDSGVWNGQWQFLVDGDKYTLGTVELPGTFVEEFMGGYGSGGLPENMGQGYTVTVPELAVIFLLGQGLLIFSIFGRHCKVKVCFVRKK